jgi:hypothetical protein
MPRNHKSKGSEAKQLWVVDYWKETNMAAVKQQGQAKKGSILNWSQQFHCI